MAEENNVEKANMQEQPDKANDSKINMDDIINSKVELSPKSSSLGLDFNVSPIKNLILNFIFPLIAIVVTIIVGVLFTYPTYKSIPELEDTLSQKQQKRNLLDDKLTRLNRLSDFQSALDENLNLVNKVLYTDPEVPQILDQVYQIAENSGLEISKLSYSYAGTGRNESVQKAVQVSLGGQASYDQLITLLKSIESAARYVEVEEFRYSQGQDENEGLYSSSFSLSSPYLFVQSEAVTDEPIGLDIASNSFIEFMNEIKALRYYDFINPDIAIVEESEESEEIPEPQESIEPQVVEPELPSAEPSPFALPTEPPENPPEEEPAL